MPYRVAFQVEPTTLDKISRLAPGNVSRASRASSKELAPIILRGLIVKSQREAKKTGGFAGGWRVFPSLGINIKNVKNYAVPVERGSRPHIIKPRRKKVLAWRTGGRGPVASFKASAALSARNFIFSKKVRHPGTKGKFIVPRLIRQMNPFILKTFSANLNLVFTGDRQEDK